MNMGCYLSVLKALNENRERCAGRRGAVRISFGFRRSGRITAMDKLHSRCVCEENCVFVRRLHNIFVIRAYLLRFEDNMRIESIRIKEIH